jgi:glycosyltransferase involved in cell wall biosynthesis
LGEFLAMGKAIISTPLSNELPKKMSHGENIHFISNDSELENAINLLLINKDYRKKLESGATTYYEEYVSPNSVIRYILDYKFI